MRKNNSKSNQSTNNSVGVFSDKTLTSTIRQGIVDILSTRGGDTKKWVGSITELDRALRRVVSVKTIANWPSSPSVLRRVVNNTVYGLRRSGVRVNFSRTTDSMRKRVVEFSQR